MRARTILTLDPKCPLCRLPGRIYSIEYLPKNGEYKECIHYDNSVHKWAEYAVAGDITDKNKRKVSKPDRIVCPKCKKRGRVNDFLEDLRKPYEVSYVVVHEKLKGTWGKAGTMAKRRRCYIRDKEQRDYILKRLGRYISKW